MKFFSSMLCALALTAALCGQDAPRKLYIFQDGKVFPAEKLKLSGDVLIEERPIAGGGTMEIPHAISKLAQIDFPEPEELVRANALLADGKAAEAGIAADKVMREFEKFRSIKGSYWAPAALVRIQALSASNRVPEARKRVDELKTASDDPDAVFEGRLAVIDGQIKFKQFDAAQKELDAMLTQVKGAPAARMWLLRGDINAAQGKFDAALLCYLRIPTIYPTIVELQPRAYMGAISIYNKNAERDSVRVMCEELISEYPASPEAAQAQKLLDAAQ